MLRTIQLLWHTFTPVERTVLSSVTPLLSPDAATIYAQQVAAINKVQRYLEWTEINFYRIVRGKPNWTNIRLFKCRDEFTLAKSTYLVENIEFTSRIYCVAGLVFSFVTRPSIKKHCFGIPIQIHTQIITDPNSPPTENRSKIPLPRSFYEWHNNPFTETHDWCVLQPQDTYVVHLAESDFVVLATRLGDEFLMAKLDDHTSTLYYAAHDDASVIGFSESFGEILARKSIP